MSTLGTVEQHMERAGLTRPEAEIFEAVALEADHAAEQAAVTGDEDLLQLVIARGQAMIDTAVAQLFIDRWYAKQQAPMN